MQALLQGLVAQCQADATLTVLATSGPWLGAAPETAAFPYYQIITKPAAARHAFGGQRVQQYDVTFAGFAESAAAALAMVEAVGALFDGQAFPLTQGALISAMQSAGPSVTHLPHDGPDNDVYQASVDFTFLVYETM